MISSIFILAVAALRGVAGVSFEEATALCDFIAATQINTIGGMNGWQACSPGLQSDPCASGNEWSGIICDTDSVVSIVLDTNIIEGTIPSSVGLFANLTELVLHTNFIGGTIPSEIGLLNELVILDLHDNNMDGALPYTLGWMYSLTNVSVCGNNITGTVPCHLADVTYLTTLYMDDTCDGANYASSFVACAHTSAPSQAPTSALNTIQVEFEEKKAKSEAVHNTVQKYLNNQKNGGAFPASGGRGGKTGGRSVKSSTKSNGDSTQTGSSSVDAIAAEVRAKINKARDSIRGGL